MTDRTWPTPDDDLRDAAQQACGIAELFDLLWEQDRNEGPPPYIPVSQVRVLSIVGQEYGIRMRALTRLLGAGRPSVCRLIDRLQASPAPTAAGKSSLPSPARAAGTWSSCAHAARSSCCRHLA
ncbi:hypothetical protein [Streptomyces sp. NPDC060188]|uniref:hypothetical protein n=1 Tax=Streptomyces sp. NPDC060188 TaxID=3347068 RepID=UPI00364666DA